MQPIRAPEGKCFVCQQTAHSPRGCHTPDQACESAGPASVADQMIKLIYAKYKRFWQLNVLVLCHLQND